MSKRDAPAMKLTVEDGRLVPASAWDQERLLTYRNRSTVNAYITQDKPRKLERQYWAILDRVITTCGVKQRTSEDLHDHIRLKLGFVNAKFDDGKLVVKLKSTKLMEDSEYSAYFNEAMGFLFDMTGVDPMTLKKESADVGEDEPSDAAAAAKDAGRDAATPPADVAATQSRAKATEDNAITTATMRSDGPGVASRPTVGGGTRGANISEGATAGETAPQFGPAAGDATPEAPEANVQGGIPVGANASLSGVTSSGGENPAPNSEGELDAGNPAGAPDDSGSDSASTSDAAATPSTAAEHECIDKMMATALDKTITPKEAAEILAESADMWLGRFGDERKAFVTAVFQTSKKVLRNELKPDAARRYLEELAE